MSEQATTSATKKTAPKKRKKPSKKVTQARRKRVQKAQESLTVKDRRAISARMKQMIAAMDGLPDKQLKEAIKIATDTLAIRKRIVNAMAA